MLDENQWVLWIGGIAIVSLVVGVVFYFVGQATVKGEEAMKRSSPRLLAKGPSAKPLLEIPT